MKYNKIKEAIFIERPNRFIAKVDIDGITEVVHVKNTGRCKEILRPGVRVFLAESDNPNRKTRFDLIGAEKEELPCDNKLINIDSQAPNVVAYEWLLDGGLHRLGDKNGSFFSKNAFIKREVTYKSSRFDFYIEDGERRAFLEVKGVTLENNGEASFPDAPTIRGVKHINELIECMEEGYEAYILFVIQMKGIKNFSPNDEKHKEFGEALRRANKEGVKIIAIDCEVMQDGLFMRDEVEILLNVENAT